MALPSWHVASAVPLVALGLSRAGPLAAIAAGCGAVLIDADHLVDWTLNGRPDTHPTRVYIPLHGWEFPIALLLGQRALPSPLRPVAVALAAGWACHLLLDSLVNQPDTPAAYLISHRIRHGFRRVPSGWPPAYKEPQRYAASQRPAPREALLAASLGMALLAIARL